MIVYVRIYACTYTIYSYINNLYVCVFNNFTNVECLGWCHWWFIDASLPVDWWFMMVLSSCCIWTCIALQQMAAYGIDGRISHLTTWPGDCCLHATGCSLQNIYMSLGRSSHTSHGDIVQTILVTILGDPSPGQIAMLKESNFIYLVTIILSGKFPLPSLHQFAIQLPIPCRFCMFSWLPCAWRSLSTATCAVLSVQRETRRTDAFNISVSNSKLFGASFFGAGTCGKIQRADIGDTRNTASWQVQLSSVFLGG